MSKSAQDDLYPGRSSELGPECCLSGEWLIRHASIDSFRRASHFFFLSKHHFLNGVLVQFDSASAEVKGPVLLF